MSFEQTIKEKKLLGNTSMSRFVTHLVFTPKVTKKRIKKLVDSSSSEEEEDEDQQQWKLKKRKYIKQIEQDLKRVQDSHKYKSKECKETWIKCKAFLALRCQYKKLRRAQCIEKFQICTALLTLADG